METDTRRAKVEFDAFGPWIDEVRALEDVPPLYDGHPLDLASALLVLKVPRNISRRDAHAGMDLYDHLMVLSPDSLTVLSRDPHPATGAAGYSVRVVTFGDLVAVRDGVSLLDGLLSVHARDGGTVSVGYNGSASQTVDRLTDALRAAMATAGSGGAGRLGGTGPEDGGPADASPPDLPAPEALGPLDVALITSYRELARRVPGLRVLSMHRRAVVRPMRGGGAAGAVQRALHVIAPMVLQGAIVASDGAFLEIVGRSAGLLRGRAPVHSRSRLVVPLTALEAVEVAPHRTYAGVSVVTLVAGRTRLELPVPAGGDAERALRGLVAR